MASAAATIRSTNPDRIVTRVPVRRAPDVRIGAAAQTVRPAREFRRAVLAGLSAPLRSLPHKYAYDALGCELAAALAQSPDSRLAQSEPAIVSDNAASIAQLASERSVLVEFGCGASIATEALLDNLRDLRAYAPVDHAARTLSMTARRFHGCFPDLDIRPIVADLSRAPDLPNDIARAPRTILLPEATLGALRPNEACDLLVGLTERLRGDLVLACVDHAADIGATLRACDDDDGLMAAFNLNLLERINTELGADFDVHCFRHEAIWNSSAHRVEQRLVSLCNQRVTIAGREFRLLGGERIHTSAHQKYSAEGFEDLARAAGLDIRAIWGDLKAQFSLYALSPA